MYSEFHADTMAYTWHAYAGTVEEIGRMDATRRHVVVFVVTEVVNVPVERGTMSVDLLVTNNPIVVGLVTPMYFYSYRVVASQ